MNQDEAEQVARALEETAALVRRCPPDAIDMDWLNEPLTAPTGALGTAEIVGVLPVRRFFRLDWNGAPAVAGADEKGATTA